MTKDTFRRDSESYFRAACVLELLMVNVAFYIAIPDNFLTNRPKDINDMRSVLQVPLYLRTLWLTVL